VKKVLKWDSLWNKLYTSNYQIEELKELSLTLKYKFTAEIKLPKGSYLKFFNFDQVFKTF
jgi:hypothetical protein